VPEPDSQLDVQLLPNSEQTVREVIDNSDNGLTLGLMMIVQSVLEHLISKLKIVNQLW
jgi:hypothetical protein